MPHHDLTRRRFMARTAQSCLGVSLAGSSHHWFGSLANAAADPAGKGGKAKRVIYIFLSGGLSHLDTFDPKPDAEDAVRGSTEAIKTNADGILVGNCLPTLAKEMDKVAIIRSMNSTQGAHAEGAYHMRTSYNVRSTVVHPSAGAWTMRLGEDTPSATDLPGYISIHGGSRQPGCGFFEPEYGPLPVGQADHGLPHIGLRPGTSEKQFVNQVRIAKFLDREFDAHFIKRQKTARAHAQMYDEAVKLMQSKDLVAFDLAKESKETQQLYGSSKFGRGCLLARRLVEHGVRYVEVNHGGFDWHDNIASHIGQKMPDVDQTIGALIHDLDAKGLLDDTLVAVATEFGRKPQIDRQQGRGHHPAAFSCLLAGGGIQGGQIYGQTDSNGQYVEGETTSAGDFNATIGHALGLNYTQPLMSPAGRPFKMGGRHGKPIVELFG